MTGKKDGDSKRNPHEKHDLKSTWIMQERESFLLCLPIHKSCLHNLGSSVNIFVQRASIRRTFGRDVSESEF